ncbi:MAG: 4Fe-4S double cluster binding domain-containing protein [Candidatus Thorarchaeota archaeon]
MEDLQASGKLSDNETFRSYIEGKVYALPDDFLDAKSLIIMAVYTPIARADFEYHGERREIVIPHQYYDSGVTKKQLETTIHEQIIQDKGFRVEIARNVFLKQVAVRSGLGRYGKNNLCYVGNMGSLITLYAFWTDFEFDSYDWTELAMMDACKTCKICSNQCPTHAIRESEFVIDAGRCISLYNEVNGEFPEWIPSNAHNALMGCLRCQQKCPANRSALDHVIQLDTVIEAETRAILNGAFDETLSETLGTKLSKFSAATSAEYFPIFTRNLTVLLKP